MRTREEIENEAAISDGASQFFGGGTKADTNSLLILEVVLDIRDLLTNKE